MPVPKRGSAICAVEALHLVDYVLKGECFDNEESVADVEMLTFDSAALARCRAPSLGRTSKTPLGSTTLRSRYGLG